EHAESAVRRSRVGRGVLELATEVEPAQKAEHLTQGHAGPCAQLACEVEAGPRMEEQPCPLPGARRRREEEYPAWGGARHFGGAGSVWRVRAWSFQGSCRNDASRRPRFDTVK